MLFLIVLGCWISAVYAEEIAVVTVPKSGTHLIKKLLELVDEERTYPILRLPRMTTKLELCFFLSCLSP